MRRAALIAIALAACSSTSDERIVTGKTASALGVPTKLKSMTGGTPYNGPPGNYNNSNAMTVGGKLVFLGHDTLHGFEPWVSDGTAAGTVLLRDTDVGISNGVSSVGKYASLGAVGAFVAGGGQWLWRTDGSPAGTYPLVSSGNPTAEWWQLAKSGTSLYAIVYVNSLWKTDGSVLGTTKVKDGTFYEMVDVAGTLYLAATTGLYKSDGSTVGTTLVSSAVMPWKMAPAGGWLYFVRGNAPSELWHSDGAGTTEKVTTLPAEAFSMTSYGTSVLFTVKNPATGCELWKVDTGGAALVKQINSNVNAICDWLTVANSVVMFGATDANGTQVWKSDGTSNGTSIVKILGAAPGNDGLGGAFSPHAAVWNNGVAFNGYAGSSAGYETMFTDGTDAGTVLVAELIPGSQSGGIATLFSTGATLFIGQGGVQGALWKSTGIGNATMLRVMDPGTPAAPKNLVANGNKLYFTTTEFSTQLWSSDGSVAGTTRVRNDNTVTGASNLTVMGGKVYFAATSTATGNELFVSDGSSAGTVVAADIATTSSSSDPSHVTGAGTHVFFHAKGPQGVEPYAYDPIGGAVLLADINPSGDSNGGPFIPFKAGALFDAYDPGTGGAAVWYSDGTPSGTLRLGAGSVETGAAVIGGTAYFSDLGLSKTDGTTTNTSVVKSFGANIYYPTAVGTKVLFSAADDAGAKDYELWVSDGTAMGTSRVIDLDPGAAGSYPDQLVAFGTKVVFRAFDGSFRHWYASDGTDVGTTKLSDAVAGECAPLVAGTTVFLCVADAAGEELWTSDGTPAGTTRWLDLNPGAARSAPDSLTLAGGKLFFTGYEITTPSLYVADPGLPNPTPDAGAADASPVVDAGTSSSTSSSGSTSTSSTSGSNAQPLDDANGNPAGDSGCGCRTIPRRRSSGACGLLALALLIATARRTCSGSLGSIRRNKPLG